MAGHQLTDLSVEAEAADLEAEHAARFQAGLQVREHVRRSERRRACGLLSSLAGEGLP